MYCNSPITKKNGTRKDKQMYKCHACGKQFIGGERLAPDLIWKDDREGKQTYLQLAKKYNCSKRTIQRKIDLCKINISIKAPREIIVLMDTTYRGHNFGVMLIKDNITKANLLKYYVKTETVALYKRGIQELLVQGFIIKAIVCDGIRGLLTLFEKIPVQMCQFHQAAIIRRYITKSPRMPAAIEHKEITAMIKQTDKESFEGALKDWYDKWKTFLNERTKNEETGKSFYTHKRLRSTYRSLNTNIKWFFTWYDNPELNIPNTTNAIDGHFADLKNKLRNHNGLSIKRKVKFIDEFLKA
ncbi:MAG: IS256 family transposase, variant Zn-binding type [Bacteroidales bacterium]